MSSILLVEDSPTQSLQMKLLLESAAHQVTCCDDGTIALEHLSSGTCELVVTDLELPMMNGLELIKKMQADFPDIPAVLVTGHGSERLAAEALRVGATGYVPKSLVNDMLLGTVEDVLGIVRSDRSYAELIDCTVENRLVFKLPNSPRLLVTAIDLTMQLAAGMQLLSGVDRYRVGNALRHAASNAIYRGNLELSRQQWQQMGGDDAPMDSDDPIVAERLASPRYQNRHVHYDARLMKDFVRVVIRDEGPGFDTKNALAAAESESLDENQGRGLVLIRNFMDKVSFNTAGNEITLVKHCIQS
ncbi:MAG: response regulator [Planctomycetales bacterium]|nr:response regulator [Planctomycetales bacterium]